jgi:hypothetical protein
MHHHGACEEEGCQRRLGPSSREDRLPHCRQGGRDFGGSARRALYSVGVQEGGEEGVLELHHHQSLQRQASLPVH